MIRLFLFSLILVPFFSTAQQPDILGTWECYEAVPYNTKKEMIADTTGIKSTLELNTDSTFTIVTKGHEIVMGYFTCSPGSIILFKLIGFEDYQRFWEIRWTPGEKDPYPNTKGIIDINLPTVAKVKHRKKNTEYVTDVYGLYKRIE